jgi:hypothetical protein
MERRLRPCCKSPSPWRLRRSGNHRLSCPADCHCLPRRRLLLPMGKDPLGTRSDSIPLHRRRCNLPAATSDRRDVPGSLRKHHKGLPALAGTARLAASLPPRHHTKCAHLARSQAVPSLPLSKTCNIPAPIRFPLPRLRQPSRRAEWPARPLTARAETETTTCPSDFPQIGSGSHRSPKTAPPASNSAPACRPRSRCPPNAGSRCSGRPWACRLRIGDRMCGSRR